MKASTLFLFAIAVTLSPCSRAAVADALAANPPPPVAPVRNVTDTYFGTTVDDPYRYMENLADPEVAAWIKAQAAYSRNLLDGIPGRAQYLARLRALDSSVAAQVWSICRRPPDRYFCCRGSPNENAPKLYVRDGLTGPEKLLVDPAAFAKSTGKPCSISFYEPSWDGTCVAFGIFSAGSEDTVLHVLQTSTATEIDQPIDRVRFPNISWHPTERAFFYTRLSQPVPGVSAGAGADALLQRSRVYLHHIGGDADRDPPVFGFDVSPRVRMGPGDIPRVDARPDSTCIVGVLDHGGGQPRTVYAAPLASATNPDIPWRRICDVDEETTSRAVCGDDIYLLSHKNAPRFKVIKTSLANPDLAHAETVVPPGDAVVTGLAAAHDALYVQTLDAGMGRLWRVPKHGKVEAVNLPAGSAAIAAYDARCDGLLVAIKSWTKAAQIYSYDPHTRTASNTRLQPFGPFDAPDDLESIEVKAKSYDGTMVPLSIVCRRGSRLDGSHPTTLLGYGAFGEIEPPVFGAMELAWFEKGGVIAMAHVRGGGECGEDWHKAGYKLTKPNTWKDYIACARYLIDHKYTTPRRLAASGGSAGGVLVGRAMTERPDLFAAVISIAGSLDMVRSETSAFGKLIVPEFGSVATRDGFQALYEMSAYHHVRDGTPYPAVLLMVGFNDTRVPPWASAKMAARLQAATTSGKPVLLQVNYEAGHGIGTARSQVLEEMADRAAFLFWQFGVPEFQPPSTK
ncbi:MAG TPA: prolyl oligopeptidase family serine peptidase [Verrucomicrobiae bacterium]|nr:prolyl oligopeptidase family serine peptidase [Verrucomicrobiae bacterium]